MSGECKTGWNPYGDSYGMCMATFCTNLPYECCAACPNDCNSRCGYATEHTKKEKELIRSMSKIADNILDILGECRTEGNTLFLPDRQLERSIYQAVNKVLESIGGKWDRKAKGHVFAAGDPAELLDNVILAGKITDFKKQYQFFPTPKPVSEKMCELAELDATCIVLEPSCGKGDLADVIYEAGVKELVGLELNREMEKSLTGKPYTTLTGIDFLEFVKDPGIKTPWTRIVMNPPFSRQQDIDHILTAYGILQPGGILVSVVSESPFFRSNKKSVDFRAFLEEREAVIVPLDEGAFKESGTMVRTRLMKIVKPLDKEESPKGKSEVKAPPQAQKHSATGVTGKAGFNINDRCPLQSECERKRCDYKFQERECSYYQGNSRPGAEIVDQTEASDSEYEEWEEEILASTSEEDSEEELSPGLITEIAPSPSGLMMPLPVDKLIPHPDNPRKDLGDLTELADSIKANGIFQNLTVVPVDEAYETFTVVIGHRRLAAAKLAGLKEVPCVIASMDAKEQIRTMLLENMQRSDLTVYEQAQGFQMMLDMGDTVEEIAEKSGFSKTTVRRRVKLLELDADKFKKSEARGATLQDYIELEKIETPELKNKVLDTIGTANFKDALKKAVDDEKHQRRVTQWETDLEAFALKIEKRDYVGEISVPMDYVRNYGRWSPKDTTVEKPEDSNLVKYYYVVGENEIDLYKDHQERVETEEERQRRERGQARNKVANELRGITERHYALRTEFIAAYSASKRNLPRICEYAASVIVGDGMWRQRAINAELAGKLLDLDVDDNTEYPEFKAMMEQCTAKTPEYALLACAYAAVEKDGMGYWAENWNAEKREYEIAHKSNSELDRLYDFLVSLGYKMSDEEKEMRDGTHELLHGQEEANESET